MSPQERAAFEASAGYSSDHLSLLIAMLVCAIALLWSCWVLLVSYKGWSTRAIKLEKVGSAALRITILVSLIVYLASK